MTFHHLAHPPGIEQVGEALRRILRLHQIGVIAERGQPHPGRHPQPIGVVVLRRVMARDFLRQIGREPVIARPYDEVGAVRAVDHVDGVDAALHLLSDALEHALGARTFHPNGDTGKFRLERLGEFLRDREVHGGVERELAFLPGGLDQRRRDRLGRRRASLRLDGTHRGDGGRNQGADCRRCPEHIASGESNLAHCFLPVRPFPRPYADEGVRSSHQADRGLSRPAAFTPRTVCCSAP